MKQLLNMRLFSLFTDEIENNQVANEMSMAYEEFAVKIFDKFKVESDSELYYNLGFVRLELIGLRNKISGEKGKKCFYFY